MTTAAPGTRSSTINPPALSAPSPSRPRSPTSVYVGSGEGLQRPDLSVGDGMYKSTDAGKTWRHLGPARCPADPRKSSLIRAIPTGCSSRCSDIPTARTPSAASSAPPMAARAFRRCSIKTSAPAASILPSTRAIRKLSMPCSGRRSRARGKTAPSAAPTAASTNPPMAATTWSQLTGGLPTFEKDGLGRIGIGIAPSRSEPACMPWLKLERNRAVSTVPTTPAQPGSASTASIAFTAAATISLACAWTRRTSDVVYVANTSTYRSTDAGQTFTAIKGAPGGDDYHTIWINPANPNIIMLAADQGATISVNYGRTWSSWYNQPTAQFYHVITDNQVPYCVYGGQQESGSVGHVEPRQRWPDHVPRMASRGRAKSMPTSRPTR